MTALLQRLPDRQRYRELRRRILRAALMPVFRATDARLRQTSNLSESEIRRILVCRPNHRLGNLVLLSPLLAELQRAFPHAEVDLVLAGPDGPDLFAGFANVRRVYALSRRMVRHPLALVRTAVRIRRAGYDLAIDPCESSQSSRLLVVLAKAKYVIGLPRSGTTISTDEREAILRAPPHMAQWPVHLLRQALVRRTSQPDRSFPELDIRLSADERQGGRQALDERLRARARSDTAPVMGLFADATGDKRYPRDWWRRFIAEVRRLRPGCAFIEILPPDGHPRLALDLPTFHARNPREVAAVISNCACFVSADCGVMHLASASGAPTFGLFSVTDASKYAPYGHGSRAIVTSGKSPEAVARLASAQIDRLPGTFACDSGRPAPSGDRNGFSAKLDVHSESSAADMPAVRP